MLHVFRGYLPCNADGVPRASRCCPVASNNCVGFMELMQRSPLAVHPATAAQMLPNTASKQIIKVPPRNPTSVFITKKVRLEDRLRVSGGFSEKNLLSEHKRSGSFQDEMLQALEKEKVESTSANLGTSPLSRLGQQIDQRDKSSESPESDGSKPSKQSLKQVRVKRDEGTRWTLSAFAVLEDDLDNEEDMGERSGNSIDQDYKSQLRVLTHQEKLKLVGAKSKTTSDADHWLLQAPTKKSQRDIQFASQLQAAHIDSKPKL